MNGGAGAHLQWPDWLVIGAYLALALGAGVALARRGRGSLENFFLSGRSLPWWLAGTSMVATTFASDTPLLVTGYTRAAGVAGNWRWWGYVVSALLVVVLFARLWQRSGVLTDVEFMELRYSGRPARLLRGFKSLYQVLFVHCFVMGWVILGMTKVLVVLFDLGEEPVLTWAGVPLTPAWLVMVGCCATALVYSEVAGLWGVVLTDFVQFAFAMAGAVALLLVVADTFGGLRGLSEALAASPHAAALRPLPELGRVSLAPSTWSRPVWDFLVFVLVVPFANKNADGGGIMIQRLLASRNERHAVGAALWYAVAHNALRPWPWILVALASLLVLPSGRVESPAAGTVVGVLSDTVLLHEGVGRTRAVPLRVGDDPSWQPRPVVAPGQRVGPGQVLAATDDEQAYPLMMRRYLPPGLLGLLVASFIAAFMSTIDTHVNLASSYLVNDFYKRFVRPDAPPRHYVRVARLVGPLVMTAALVFAAASESVVRMFDVFTALFSGLGVVYLLRWVWWRINAWSEIAAMASGAAATWLLAARPTLAAPLLPDVLLDGGRPGFAGQLLLVAGASLLVTLPVTLLTPATDRRQLRLFHERVSPPGAWGPFRTPGGPSPARELLRLLVGWCGATVFVVAGILLPGELLLGRGGHAGLLALLATGGLAVLVVTFFRAPRHVSRPP